MSLTSEIQESLEYLMSNPDRPPLRSREIPTSLSREAKRYLVRLARDHPDTLDSRAIQGLNRPYAVSRELQDFYVALLDIGVEDGGTQRKLVLWFLGTNVLTVPESVILQDLGPLTDSDRIIVDMALSREGGWPVEDYELFYAVESHLCYRGDDRWHLTGLGRALLRLPVLQATRFLLALEMFLNAGEGDEWHMSQSFLQHLLQEQRMALGIRCPQRGEGSGPLSLWGEYLDRIVEFGLAGRSREKDDTVELTNLGRLMIESVLNQDSAFDSLVPIYIREEMIGTEASSFASEEDVERICRLLQKSQLVGELRGPIFQEVKRLRQAGAPFLSVFKALAPCIEGILRNLSKAENLTVKGHGLGAYIDAIEKAQPPVLKPGTLQMIDAVFRPYRNVVEHGYIIAPEPARMLCEISLSVVEQIHTDYLDFRE